MEILMKLSLLINVDCIREITNICGAKFVGHPVFAFAIFLPFCAVEIGFALIVICNKSAINAV